MKLKQESVVKLIFALLIVYVNFIQYKVYQNSLIMLGLGGMIVAITILRAMLQKKFIIEQSILVLLIFTIYMVIPTMLFGSNESLDEYLTVVEYTIILICLVNFCTSIHEIDWLIKVKLLSTVLICIAFILNPVVYHDKVNTIQYTLVKNLNPNTFSLDILIGLWALLYFNAKKKLNIILTSLISLFFLYCIFITAARKSLISAMMVMTLWALLVYIPMNGYKISKKNLKRILFISVFGICVTYYAGQRIFDSQMYYRLKSLVSGTDGSAIKRINMYLNGIDTFIKNPVFGYGFGGFQYLYGGYSHATVVEVPVSGGIIGTILYLYFFTKFLLALIR